MLAPPILAIHRRNRIDQLSILPKGCWIEIDVDVYEGVVYLHHDPLPTAPPRMAPPPDRFDSFLSHAIQAGIGGFIVDCKRENIERFVQPLFVQHGIKDYFYLNEMEVQADIFLEKNTTHNSSIRIWKYRGADEVISYARDMGAIKVGAPSWAWIDCWQHGLLQDINQAFLPLTLQQARDLQDLGLKLCICSPELYAHQYGKEYAPAELAVFANGVKTYRQSLVAKGIHPDAICTKFPQWWGL